MCATGDSEEELSRRPLTGRPGEGRAAVDRLAAAHRTSVGGLNLVQTGGFAMAPNGLLDRHHDMMNTVVACDLHIASLPANLIKIDLQLGFAPVRSRRALSSAAIAISTPSRGLRRCASSSSRMAWSSFNRAVERSGGCMAAFCWPAGRQSRPHWRAFGQRAVTCPNLLDDRPGQNPAPAADPLDRPDHLRYNFDAAGEDCQLIHES